MSVTLQNSNIVINDGTNDFIMERLRAGGKRKDTIETNAPTTSPEVDIYPISRSSNDKYLMFKYDLNMNYNKIPADDTNLIAWYKLDKGANDSSGNNKHLTHYNQNSTGYYDDAAFFGGSTYFEAANNGYFSPEVFSISVWCNLQSNSADQTIANCRVYPNTGWTIYVINSRLEVWFHNGSYTTHSIYYNFATNPSRWRHLVITVNRNTNTFKSWIDGILYDTHTGSSIGYNVDTSNPFRIGAGEAGSAAYHMSNKGLVRDFRMYNIELSTTDVTTLFNKNYGYTILNTDATNLVAWYKFDGDLNNSAIVGNIGTLVNTGTNNVTFIDSFGNYMFNKSALANDTILTIPNFHFNNLTEGYTKSFTISFWFKANSISGTWNVLFDASNYTSFTSGIRIYLNSNNYIYMYYYNNASSSDYRYSLNGTFTDDKWRLLTFVYTYKLHSNDVFTYDFRFYENGILNNITSSSGATNSGVDEQIIKSDSSYGFQIGHSAEGTEYPNEGYYDDLRIYDKALSAEEVELLYQRNNQNYLYDKTNYSITFPDDTLCDVLVVAGGGGGGMDMGGGGGAGGYIYKQNYLAEANKTIPIYVGDGGVGAPASNTFGQPSAHHYTINAKSGNNSAFGDLIAYGGGYGGSAPHTHTLGGGGGPGGSGGGSSGYVPSNQIVKAGIGIKSQGNRGAYGRQNYYSGGGGGAGEIGGGGEDGAAARQRGGNGKYNDIIGTGYYWAGGGGGSGYSTTGGNGGLGGGGGGAVNTTYGGAGYNDGEPGGGGGTTSHANRPGGNAGKHTGGGGGGGSHYQGYNKGGDGGSGIVIVRYTSAYGEYDYEGQWKHDVDKPTIKYLGNVGIGTKADDKYTLNVNGDINIIGNLYNYDGVYNIGHYNGNPDITEPIVINKAVKLAENATDNKGWYYVKYLSSASNDWYPSYGTREVEPSITHKFIFDDYNSFDKPFPVEWDEIIFIRDDSNMHNVGSNYGAQYAYMTKETCGKIFESHLNWTSIPVIKTQDGNNTNIYYYNYFSSSSYLNQTPFVMCKNRSSSNTSDTIYHERRYSMDGSVGTDGSTGWAPRTSQAQYTEYHVLVRKSQGNNTRISSITPLPFYTERTKYMQYHAEQASGVKGWRLVRYLPPNAGAWHPINDNLAGTTTYGTAYDYANAFSVVFGDFDEFLFSTGGMKHWIHVTRDQAIGTTYSNSARKIIKSSVMPFAYYANWYNRGSSNGEDPLIGLRSHGASTHNVPFKNGGHGGDLILYGENSFSSGHWSLSAISLDDGVCVFLRKSTDTEPEHSYDTEYKLLKFEHSKGYENQTEYVIDFPVETECDILVVGGGGAGGLNAGGGGGAGGLVYGTSIKMKGVYHIKVGRGGTYRSDKRDNGEDSLIYNANNSIVAKGGGSGCDGVADGNDGGSGGGGASSSSSVDKQGGTSIQQTSFIFENVTFTGYGNSGGMGRREEQGGWTRAGGGGGGAGAKGNTSGDYTEDTGQAARVAYGGDGGEGRQYDITGIATYYAGGGGGSVHNYQNTNASLIDYPGSGGTGGGGAGAQPYGTGESGVDGTGGGGGAGGGGNGSGGNGGSGIIIIKYKRFNKAPSELVQWTYKSENTDVYNMGNVAIKKEHATSRLDVDGDITGTTKNFKINHPLGYNKWLYHSSIEGPRYDNIYRGVKTIENGEAIVDIDNECNETGGMTSGTFVALNRNPQLYLRNNKTFDKVKGEIIGGAIRIHCENTRDKIEVNWMVMAERQDNNIKMSLLTNNEGNLICEKNRL